MQIYQFSLEINGGVFDQQTCNAFGNKIGEIPADDGHVGLDENPDWLDPTLQQRIIGGQDLLGDGLRDHIVHIFWVVGEDSNLKFDSII